MRGDGIRACRLAAAHVAERQKSSYIMGRKLYVGNLPFTANETDLRELFATAGAVETVNIVTDRDTGRPRGFAFVEMSSDSDAQNAIAQLNEQDFGGRRMAVNEARPRPAMAGGGGAGGGGGRRREPRW
jgi:RNA recognition motif-containing protein